MWHRRALGTVLSSRWGDQQRQTQMTLINFKRCYAYDQNDGWSDPKSVTISLARDRDWLPNAWYGERLFTRPISIDDVWIGY